MPQAMKIPAAKAAVDKEWEKLEKISAWNLTQVRSEKEVIDEARTTGVTVHFASLMDICHLKNAELEAKHPKYKGRLRRTSIRRSISLHTQVKIKTLQNYEIFQSQTDQMCGYVFHD